MNHDPYSPTPELSLGSAAAPASETQFRSGEGISRPRVWPVLAVLAACLVLYVMTTMFAVWLAVWVVQGRMDMSFFSGGNPFAIVTRSPLGMAIMLVLPQIALVVPAVIAAIASPVPIRCRLALVRGNWPIWLWFTAAMATPLVGMISALVVGALLGESDVLDELSGVFRSLAQEGYLVPLALLVGVTPGICEELLFRGYMQTRMTAAWGAPLGILSTSVVFAIFHFDLVHSVAVLALGLYLGWIAWASGTVLAAILAHFLNNFLSVLAVAVLPQGVTEGTGAVEDVPLTAAIAVAGVVLVSGGCLVVTLFHGFRHRHGSAAMENRNQLSESGERILPS